MIVMVTTDASIIYVTVEKGHRIPHVQFMDIYIIMGDMIVGY